MRQHLVHTHPRPLCVETIIYKHDFKGKLENYLSDMTLLTWVKRLEISMGVAHALSYIHYDESHDFSVINRNINSETIWLNSDLKPKLSEFEHAVKIKGTIRSTLIEFGLQRVTVNNFASDYIIREETVKWVYQGRMLDSGQFIDIVAWGIYPKYQKQESKKFRMDNHMNVVSVIGYYDNNNMFIIYKKEANGSLVKYISDETLTWMQRLKICLGVANALSYIH
ncbi:kinase-like domain, phloem protein 2-like protein [Tanacetum coccineum]